MAINTNVPRRGCGRTCFCTGACFRPTHRAADDAAPIYTTTEGPDLWVDLPKSDEPVVIYSPRVSFE